MLSKSENIQLKQVEDYWNSNLCGHHFVKSKFPSREFFDEYRRFRYKKTHHLDRYIDWSCSIGKDVLEIGLGVGADGTRWAKYAKSYTGIDLTEEAVKATQIHLELLNLKGLVEKGNAESINFPNNNFDIVYSHGVLHHTTNIELAFKEVYRVLIKDGLFLLMVYSKSSFNYWIRIQLYFRIKLLYEIFKSKFGYRPKKVLWQDHLRNFYRKGWSYLSWNNFPHHCTDGPDCEITNIYTKSEIKELLNRSGFVIEDMKKAHFPIGGKYPKLEQFIGRYIGFHQLIWARKN